MKRPATPPRHAASLLLALAALGASAPAFADDPSCRTSAECRGGRVCRGQRCVAPQCTRDDDCGAGRYCDAAGSCQSGAPVASPAAPPPAGAPPPLSARPPAGAPPPLGGASTGPDEVVLVDGSRVRGTISVEDPRSGITLVLSDGRVRKIKAADVRRTVYGGGLGAAAPPAGLAPLAAPPAPPALPGGEGAARRAERGAPWAKPLWVSSLVTFSLVYATSAVSVSAVNASVAFPNWANSGFVLIPFAGPWIVVANAGKYIPTYASALLGGRAQRARRGCCPGGSAPLGGAARRRTEPGWPQAHRLGALIGAAWRRTG
jgi:hypothetical protein